MPDASGVETNLEVILCKVWAQRAIPRCFKTLVCWRNTSRVILAFIWRDSDSFAMLFPCLELGFCACFAACSRHLNKGRVQRTQCCQHSGSHAAHFRDMQCWDSHGRASGSVASSCQRANSLTSHPLHQKATAGPA